MSVEVDSKNNNNNNNTNKNISITDALNSDLNIGGNLENSASNPQNQSNIPKCSTLEELSRYYRGFKADHYSGAILRIIRPLSNHLQTCHTLTLPEDLTEGSYSYGATYVGKIINESEAFPIMNAEISPKSGNFNGVFIHKLSENLVARINASYSSSKWLASHLCLDYQTKNYSWSIYLDKFNPFLPKGTICLQYLRKINDNLMAGLEFQTHNNANNMPKSDDLTDQMLVAMPNSFQKLSAIINYKYPKVLDAMISISNKSPQFSLSLTNNSLFDSFIDKSKCDLLLSLNLDFLSKKELAAASLAGIPGGLDAFGDNKNFSLIGDFGYILKLKSNGCVFKSSLRSDGTIIGNADYPIQGLPLTIGFSGAMSFVNAKFSTGFRLVLGQ